MVFNVFTPRDEVIYRTLLTSGVNADVDEDAVSVRS